MTASPDPRARAAPATLVFPALAGAALATAIAIPYAAALVYAPNAYLGVVLPVMYGAAVGRVTGAVAARTGVDRRGAVASLAVATATLGYVLSWPAWAWLTLHRTGQDVAVAVVVHPGTLFDLLELFYANGAWTLGTTGHADAVAGPRLALVWACEAGLVLGAAAASAARALR